MELFRKPGNWWKIYKQTTFTFYTSNKCVSLKRVEEKILGGHNKDQVYYDTRVLTQVNTSQHESTRANTNQHESDTSPKRVNTNQHEFDTSQHESDTS